MKVIRLPYYRSEAILQDVIDILHGRSIPPIGVFESRQFMIGGDSDKRITTLSLMPENVHLSVRTNHAGLVYAIWYRRTTKFPELEEIQSWTFDTANEEDKNPALSIAANAAFFFLWARDAFKDFPWLFETWDSVFPEFVDTTNSLEHYMAWASDRENKNVADGTGAADRQADARRSSPDALAGGEG